MARVLTIQYEDGTVQSLVTGDNIRDHLTIEWAIQQKQPTARIETHTNTTVIIQVSKVNSYSYGEYLDNEEADTALAGIKE